MKQSVKAERRLDIYSGSKKSEFSSKKYILNSSKYPKN